ncbi:hypothetical protein BB558_003706 [Smittium angustum]|uniref:PHD-type domain-containing protein n=1 Tax=Smittium angustum TaxID=133377 RepID=A0A2U1J5C0_SMIAN|nr:hypothetical protein BB558_003706 [Smittium angustum]
MSDLQNTENSLFDHLQNTDSSPNKRKRGRPPKITKLIDQKPSESKEILQVENKNTSIPNIPDSQKKKKKESNRKKQFENSIYTTGAFYTRHTANFLATNSGFFEPNSTLQPETKNLDIATKSSLIVPGAKVNVRETKNSLHKGMIKAFEKGKVLVHYCGWDKTYDQWLDSDSKRLLPYENLSSDCNRQRELAGESSIVSITGVSIGQKILVLGLNNKYYKCRVLAQLDGKILVYYNKYGPEHCEWIDNQSRRIKTISKNSNDSKESSSMLKNIDSGNSSNGSDDGQDSCGIQKNTTMITLSLLKKYQALKNKLKAEKNEKRIFKNKLYREQNSFRFSIESITPNTDKSNLVENLKEISDSTNGSSSSSDIDSSSSSSDDSDYLYNGRGQFNLINKNPLPQQIPENACKPITDILFLNENYNPIPQQLKLKQYSLHFYIGMQIVVRGSKATVYWPATVTKIVNYKVSVKYEGWPQEFDEVVDANSSRILIKKSESKEMVSAILADLSNDSFKKSYSSGVGNTLTKTKQQPLSLRLAAKQVISAEIEQENINSYYFPQDKGTIKLPHKEMSQQDYKVFFKPNDKIRAQISLKNYFKYFSKDPDFPPENLWMDAIIDRIGNGNIVVNFGNHHEIISSEDSDSQSKTNINNDHDSIEQKDIVNSGYPVEKMEISEDAKLDQSVIDVEKQKKTSGVAVTVTERYALNSNRIRVLLETINSDGRLMDIGTNNKKKKAGVSNSKGKKTSPNKKNEETSKERKQKRNLILEETIGMLEKQLVIIDTKSLSSDEKEIVKGIPKDVLLEGHSKEWMVYCNSCKMIINCFRYYCTKCEVPDDSYNYQSFELCFMCFSNHELDTHPHPATDFARQPVSEISAIVQTTNKSSSSLSTFLSEKLLEKAKTTNKNKLYLQRSITFTQLILSNPVAEYVLDLIDKKFTFKSEFLTQTNFQPPCIPPNDKNTDNLEINQTPDYPNEIVPYINTGKSYMYSFDNLMLENPPLSEKTVLYKNKFKRFGNTKTSSDEEMFDSDTKEENNFESNVIEEHDEEIEEDLEDTYMLKSMYHSQHRCAFCGEKEYLDGYSSFYSESENFSSEDYLDGDDEGKSWGIGTRKRKKTGNVDDDMLGLFASEYPFIVSLSKTKRAGDDTEKDVQDSKKGDGEYKRFWVHDSCARFSPRVLVEERCGQDAVWYNVGKEVSRGRNIKCGSCGMRGATIGCFDSKCKKSFHVRCSGMPLSKFQLGYVYYCPKHYKQEKFSITNPQSKNNEIDHGFSPCFVCSTSLNNKEMWYTCTECYDSITFKKGKSQNNGFNLCIDCYSFNFPQQHPHKISCFKQNYSKHYSEHTTTSKSESQLQLFDDHENKLSDITPNGSNNDPQTIPSYSSGSTVVGNSNSPIYSKLEPDKILSLLGGNEGNEDGNVPMCSYCWSKESTSWRRGYGNVIMCEPCFENANEYYYKFRGNENLGSLSSSTEKKSGGGFIGFGNSDTLEALNPFGTSKFDFTGIQELSNENPNANYSAGGGIGEYTGYVDDYSHSPYFTRDSLLPAKQGLIDGISIKAGVSSRPSFLAPLESLGALQNYKPTKSMSWSLRVASTYFSVDGRAPRWASHQDSRNLKTILGNNSQRYFNNKTVVNDYSNGAGVFDFVLSHPPYKDCVSYSGHIAGDLSMFSDPIEFQMEMKHVVDETHRLLKMNRFITLGIGDNRSQCFYIPVGFQLMRNYIDNGFDMIELIVKRQRHCQAFGLGLHLCVQYDFLVFTHEYIVTFRKVPKTQDEHLIYKEINAQKQVNYYTELPDERLSRLKFENNENQDPVKIASGYGFVASTIYQKVKPSPIDRKSVAMGTVWTFQTGVVGSKKYQNYTFGNMIASRIVQRFGQNFTCWQLFSLCSKQSHDFDFVDEKVEKKNMEENLTYEQKRQLTIHENKQKLLHLGLVSELGEEGNDIPYMESLGIFDPKFIKTYDPENLGFVVKSHPNFTKPNHSKDSDSDNEELPLIKRVANDKLLNVLDKPKQIELLLSLVVIPHIEEDVFWSTVGIGNGEGGCAKDAINKYRRMLVDLVINGYKRLMLSGLLVVGVKDYRDPIEKELWPLGMLVTEDVENSISSTKLRLKETIVCVPSGHENVRDNSSTVSILFI